MARLQLIASFLTGILLVLSIGQYRCSHTIAPRETVRHSHRQSDRAGVRHSDCNGPRGGSDQQLGLSDGSRRRG